MAWETGSAAGTTVPGAGQSTEQVNVNLGAGSTPNAVPGLGESVQVNPALNALTFFTDFGVGATSPEIEKYLEDVTKAVNLSADGNKAPIEVERRRLTDPVGAYAFIAASKERKFASVVIFSDVAIVSSTLTGDFTPPSRLIVQARKALVDKDPSINVVNVYVITKDDLDRSAQMANRLRIDLYPFATGMTAASAQDISAGSDFTVEINTAAAKQAIERMSPHKVQPRIDFGFMVYFKPKNSQTVQIGQNARIAEAPKPLLAVGGYTEVFGPYPDPETRRPRFLPVFKITDITAVAPVLGSILVGAMSTVQLVAQQGMWLQQFNDLSKNKPNLGNVMMDNGKLWHAETLQQRDEFVASNYQMPYVALSIVEGRARIPTLAMFEDSAYNKAILDATQRFFRSPQPAGNITVGQPLAIDYIGTYGTGDNKRDSRDLTYLDLVAKNSGIDPNVARTLLQLNKTPKDRAQIASQYLPDFVPLYREVTVALSAPYLGYASSIKGDSFNITDTNGSTSLMPTIGLGSAFNNFSNMNGVIGMGGNAQNWNGAGVPNLALL